MNTPDFNLRHRDLFTETEKNVLKEFNDTIERACLNCEDCDWCILTNFCRRVKYNGDTTSPGELLTEILSTLGVNLD